MNVDSLSTDKRCELDVIRMTRVFNDPVVYPEIGSSVSCSGIPRELITTRRMALLMEATEEPVDVATWPETAIYLSSMSLAVPLDETGRGMYGHAFSKLLDQMSVPNADQLLESVSSIIPDEPTDCLLSEVTKLRRQIRRTQHRQFLDEVYPDLDTDIPKSFWNADGAVSSYPIVRD